MAPKISAEYVPYTLVKPEGPRNVTERVDIKFPEVGFHNSVGQALAHVGEQGYGTLSRSTKAVGDAFDNLGKNLEHVGDQLWNRAIGLQDVQNQTTQTKAEIEFDKYVGEKQVAFNQLQGEAATEGAFKAHLKDIEDKRTEMLGKLPNQAVQKGFERSTASTIGRVGMQAAGHAADETRKSFIASSEARVDQYKDQMSKTTDVNETADLAKKVHDEVFGKQAPAKGWTLDVANNNFRKILGESYASQISTISRTDPTTARKMLETEENKALIPQPLYDSTMDKVLMNERVLQSRNIGNEIQDADPDGPLDAKIDKAKERAKEINPNAPLLAEDAVRSVGQKHEEHRREVRQNIERNKEIVEQELYGFGNKEGHVPTKVEDLWVNPETRKAWEALPDKEKNRVAQILQRSAKGDYPDTPMARGRMWELQGMAINEPGRFRDLDLLMEEIPWTMRSQLREMQLKSIKEGIKLENDPKTSGAISQMRSALIFPKDLTPAHKDKWNTFTGLVREALIDQGKQRGFDKPLSNEEIVNLGRTLLDKMPGTGWFGSDWSAKQLYQTVKEVPDDVKAEIQKTFPGISDEMVLQKYQALKIRQEYNKRYGTSGTKSQPQAPTVTAKTPPEPPPTPPPEEQQGPPKPAEKRSEMLTRRAAEFRSRLISPERRKKEEERAGQR